MAQDTARGKPRNFALYGGEDCPNIGSDLFSSVELPRVIRSIKGDYNHGP